MNVAFPSLARKKLYRKHFSFFLCFLSLVFSHVACKKARPKASLGSGAQQNTSADQEEGLKAFDEKPKTKSAQLPAPKVDAAVTELYGVQLLELTAKDGQTDFDSFRYEISFGDTKTKQQGTFAVSEQIPLMLGGKIQIKLEGCIENYRVIDMPCGKAATQYLQVPVPNNQASLPLLIQRYELITQIQSQVQKVKDAILAWEKSPSANDPQIKMVVKNWRIYGESKNGAFYASKEFKDIVFGKQTLSDLAQQKSLGLTTDSSTGNWAYPDGNIPQGKPIATERDEKEASTYQSVGLGLLVAGSIAAVVGFTAMRPNKDIGEFILQEYAVSLKKIQAMEIILAAKKGTPLIANTETTKALNEYREAIEAKASGDQSEEVKKLIGQATPYTADDLAEFPKGGSFDQSKFLTKVAEETDTHNYLSPTKDKMRDLHEKSPKEIQELIDAEKVNSQKWAPKKTALMERIDPKDSSRTLAKATGWESIKGDIQHKVGKWTLIAGTAAAIIGAFAISTSYDKVQLTDGTSGSPATELENQLDQIVEKIKELFLKIEAIDTQLAAL